MPSTDAGISARLASDWRSVNVAAFGGALEQPSFVFDEEGRFAARWEPERRVIHFRESTFELEWAEIREILKREMARQYVSEVLGVDDETSCGQAFRVVCRRHGIEARADDVPEASARVDELDTIYEGDCLAVMRRMRSGSVDAIITSPPYNLRNSSGGGMRNGSGGLWSTARLLRGYAEGGDDMPRAAYIAWQRACLAEMMRLVPDTGVIFYVHKRRVQDGLEEDPKVDILYDFPVRQTITWVRAGGINFNPGYFLPKSECIYMICKSGKFRLARHPEAPCSWGDVWSIPQGGKSNMHPAPFPIELPLRCIQATNARVVLDPFMGSGTTAIAAEMLGRHWIGIELSKSYAEMAGERLAQWRSTHGASTVRDSTSRLASKDR